MKAYLAIFFLFSVLVKQGFTQQRRNELGNPIVLEDSKSLDFVQGEVIIKFKDSVLDKAFQSSPNIKIKIADAFDKDKAKDFQRIFKENALRKLVTKFKPEIKESITRKGNSIRLSDFHNLMVLETDKGADIKELCKTISKLEGIEYAEPNFLIKVTDSPPNDINYAQQTGFEQANGHDIDANRAWDFTSGNYNIKVAVIDNGIAYHNPDLGNGNFGFEGAKVRGGWDYVNNDADPDYTEADINSHGTECAGIIGALRNNVLGIGGLAGGNGNGNIGVQLFALKVGPVNCSDGTLRCLETTKIIDAIISAIISSSSLSLKCVFQITPCLHQNISSAESP